MTLGIPEHPDRDPTVMMLVKCLQICPKGVLNHSGQRSALIEQSPTDKVVIPKTAQRNSEPVHLSSNLDSASTLSKTLNL